MFRMMIIEDEVWMRKGLEKMLAWDELHIQHVASARNGQEALELMDECKPDIILTDIKMPKIDGFGMLDKISEITGRLPKIIIISGYDDFEFAKKAIQHAVIDYILKPVDPEELEKSLTKAIKMILHEAEQAFQTNYYQNQEYIDIDIGISLKEETLILKALQKGDKGFVKSIIDDILEKYNSLEQKRIIHFQLYLFLSRYLTAEQLKSPNRLMLLHKFKSAYTFEELRGIYNLAFEPLVDEIIQNFTPSKINYISQAKEYIDMHYNNSSLSLDQIAEHLNLSPAYLSFIIKKETGINFTSHVTQKRIESAKDLLLNSDMPLYEVSVEVGYNDVKYFLKVFKKETGFTPNRYRELYK
ncbi:response regulator [Sporosarcina sp. ACRSM]|uniref:response regulator transcription factor n=1 Tax=Sporosarcina sp. ACRSM TaxID=2918216 RepID=UPI001EF48056|nr:response regulator [Sporosarcina sp. ACRSM]MCG7334625.1 response regulator [Sporosarcina sp. ACRSM]